MRQKNSKQLKETSCTMRENKIPDIKQKRNCFLTNPHCTNAGEKRKGRGGKEIKEKNREHVHKTSSVRGKAEEEDRNKKEGTKNEEPLVSPENTNLPYDRLGQRGENS